MRAGVGAGATALQSARRRVAIPALPAGLAGLPVAAALFFGGGASDDALFPVGVATVVVATALAAAALVGALPWASLDRSGILFVILLSAFALWTGLSILWSIQPDRSWTSFNRACVYLAFALLGVIAGALLERAPRAVAIALAAALALVVAWALLGKVVPSLFPDGARRARLREPVGYWNALALLTGMALVLSLWIASERWRRRSLRAAGVVLAYAAVVATVLTYSRGGLAIAAVAVVLWLAVSRSAFEGLVALALAVPAAVAVSGWALTRPGVADDGESYATRVYDGRLFGAVFVLGAAAVFGLAHLAARRAERSAPSPPVRRRAAQAAAVAGVAAVALAVSASVVSAGGLGSWIEARKAEFANPTTVHVTEGPGRLGTLSSNHRWTWWGEAWESFTEDPVAGKGAGSFGLVNRLLREGDLDVAQPHSVPLQFLSDTGLVGFLLAVGALVAAAFAAVGGIRRLGGVERRAAVALAVAALAYVLHALIDIDWDYAAVTAPFLFVLGVLAAAGRPATRLSARVVGGAAAVAMGAAVVASLALPWLAERRHDDAFAALERDPAAAAARAEQAHELNPLAVEPLLTWALAEESRGNLAAAEARYRDAVELQPLNPDTWYALGSFQLDTLRQPLRAYLHLLRSYDLDRFGPAAETDALERARRAVARTER